jgi:hypothetical protein
MADTFVFPKRMIHLDFHTGPWVPDVACEFDAQQFAQPFKAAHIDSVTVFAKCHHGQLYFNTDHPARHPSLPKGLNLLGEQVDALHRVGIRAPIYISVQCDEFAANTHPEWIALTSELRHVKGSGSAYKPAWQILDMSSPYQDYLADQIDEVMRRFAPVDGIFLDMCWDQPSHSKWAIDGMKRRGLDPRDDDDHAKYARMVVHDYMARYRQMVDDAQARAHGAPIGIWFNSRPKAMLFDEQKYLRHVEIESLPTGGWGYAYFPYVARFVRPLGLPTLSMTGRFHKSWGDNSSLKPRAALLYECCQILSQGLSVSVGDLLHPRAVPHPATYDLIGGVYGYMETCQKITEGATLVSEVAMIINPDLGDNPGPAGLGAVRALQQLRQQFDLVAPTADISAYKLVIVPETTHVDDALRARLQAYLAAGGKLMIVGPAALDDAGQPVMPELGIETHGESPYTHTFLHHSAEIGQGIPAYDTVMYDRGFRMTPAAGSEVLCGVVEPYFERAYDHFSGHEYTAPDRLSPYAAIIQNGPVITCSVPLFEAFGRHANVPYRQLIGNCLDRLLPQPLLRDGGPAHLETTVMRGASGGSETTIVHVISFLPSRQAEGMDIVTDAFPAVDMPLAVRLDAAPSRVTLQPSGQAVPFTYENGYAHVRLTVLDGHTMVVFE